MINCETSLTLTWFENCVLTSKEYREAAAGDNPVLRINAPMDSIFKILTKNCMFQ